MHPFHRLVRRIAILSGTVGLLVIAMALLSWTTGLLGARGWELLSLIGGVGALLGAVLTWRLQRLPLLETPRSPRTALVPAGAPAVAGALVGAFVSYLFSDVITAVLVGTLVLVSGALGVWLGTKVDVNWPGSDPDR
jgi:uncharacterized membrane protein YfcA